MLKQVVHIPPCPSFRQCLPNRCLAMDYSVTVLTHIRSLPCFIFLRASFPRIKLVSHLRHFRGTPPPPASNPIKKSHPVSIDWTLCGLLCAVPVLNRPSEKLLQLSMQSPQSGNDYTCYKVWVLKQGINVFTDCVFRRSVFEGGGLETCV
jgi:hypothetical protein